MPDQLPVASPLLLDQRVAGQTFLSKYDCCPRDAFMYRTMNRQTHAMMRGIAVHGGIDMATEYMVENGEAKIPGEAARDMFEAWLDQHPEAVVPEYERDSGRAMMWNWGEGTVLDLPNLVGHEVEVAFELDGWLLRCRIDLVYAYDDHIKIIDYKTSLALPKEEEVQRSFQGRFYALAALEGRVNGSPVPIGAGLNEVEFELLFPRYRDEEFGNLKGRGAVYSRKNLLDFKATLSGQIAQLEHSYETQEWPAVDGSHCSTCTAQELCPIRPDLKDMPALTNLAEAQELASDWYAHDRAKARKQKALRGWVAENGPIFFGKDLALDLTTRDSSKTDWPGLERGVNRAVEFGEPFDLSEFKKKTASTTFGKRKITEEERAD